MPRGPSPKKQETHERIVRTAATAIRRDGYDGVGVADVMDAAGLTHGGFYAHFADREALLVEALDAAAGQALERLSKAPDGAPIGKQLAKLVDHYLSDAHMANVEGGCTLAALGSDTVRQSAPIKRVMTRRIKEFADLVGRQFPTWGDSDAHDEALATVCTLVGALVIARAVDDASFGKNVRAAAKRFIDRGTAHSKRS